MIDFGKTLDLILEEESMDVGDDHPLLIANELVHELHAAQQQIADIQHYLSSVKQRLCADLAMGLRRHNPGLNVALDKQGCKVGYKTKHLLFIPDVERGVWVVQSPWRRFQREFLTAHRRSTLLTPDLSLLITSIVDHFRNHYKTLGEDIVGTGVLLVESRRATLTDVANWRTANLNPPPRRLRSRLARQVG